MSIDLSGRPTPAPETPWSIRQTWSDLLFAHWRVNGDRMREIVPEPLEIDTFDGDAWIGVVPFRMSGIRMRWFPPIPGATSTLELNVRTYVRYRGRPGVFFFSLDAASSLIVMGGRELYGLPYHRARMGLRKATYWRYECERAGGGVPRVEFRGVYRPIGDIKAAEKGSVEYFLTERYCLYTVNARGQVLCGEIDHKPWPLRKAELELEKNTMTLPLGVELAGHPRVHFAAHLDVLMWPLVAAESCNAASRGPAPDPYTQSR